MDTFFVSLLTLKGLSLQEKANTSFFIRNEKVDLQQSFDLY